MKAGNRLSDAWRVTGDERGAGTRRVGDQRSDQGANIQRSTFDAEHSTNAGYPTESDRIKVNQGTFYLCEPHGHVFLQQKHVRAKPWESKVIRLH